MGVERATGFEPATTSLGSWDSTAELHPQASLESYHGLDRSARPERAVGRVHWMKRLKSERFISRSTKSLKRSRVSSSSSSATSSISIAEASKTSSEM